LTGILPANPSLEGRNRLIFFQIDLFILNEETHLSLQRNQSALEAGDLTHCFTLWTELLLKGVLTAPYILQGEISLCAQYRPIQRVVETCISPRNIRCVTGMSN
jgi:hypothetical protein